jgi:1,4-dihydroxy-2-naphthoyl-CoA synthase
VTGQALSVSRRLHDDLSIATLRRFGIEEGLEGKSAFVEKRSPDFAKCRK